MVPKLHLSSANVCLRDNIPAESKKKEKKVNIPFKLLDGIQYPLKRCLDISIGILPKGPYPPCLRMADRALLAGYPQYVDDATYSKSLWRPIT